MALVGQGVIPPPDPADPSPFAIHDPVDLEGRLRSAGFASVRTDRLEFSQRYPSFDEYWAETLDMAAPIAGAVAGLQAAQGEAVRSAIREALSQFTSADGRLEIPATTVVAVAVA
jgi:hypothetical protein